MVSSRLMSSLSKGGLLLAVAQLSACTMLSPPGQPLGRPAPAPEPPPEAAPSEPAPQAEAPPDSGSVEPSAAPPRTAAAASRSLLAQSRAERAAGNFSGAAASLERALRIDPDDPWLWLELGQLRLEEGDRSQAEMMTRRALTLADGDGALELSANRLLDAIQGP